MTTSSAPKKLTPMMEQYVTIREKLPENSLLLFRLGDFYELFFEDAQEAAKILGLTLTTRHGTPMAGMPYHASESYINKLLKAGKKVGICDQLETPQPGKLVKRDLTRILTPGTTIEASQLDDKQNHYILSFTLIKNEIHAAWMDLSTGAFAVASDPNPLNLLPVFSALNPKELLIPQNASQNWAEIEELKDFWEQFKAFSVGRPISYSPDFQFDPTEGAKLVMDSIGVMNLEGFGIDLTHLALGPASALIQSASDTLCAKPNNIKSISEYRSCDSLLIDATTLKSLEVFQSSSDLRKATLLGALDNTITAAGARLLEAYLSAPLVDPDAISAGHQQVEDFYANHSQGLNLRENLKTVRDLARIISRLHNKVRGPRELAAVRETLLAIPAIKTELSTIPGTSIPPLNARIHVFDDLTSLLERALNDSLPAKLNDGGIIKEGYNDELDRLLDLSRNSKQWLASFEQAQQEATGIKNLKVKFNGTFGYFIEVTKANAHLVPDHYVRKQTMTNAERYYTEELKEKEKEILNAQDLSLDLELRLFAELVETVLEHSSNLYETAHALAELDLFVGWALLAHEWNYTRPSIDAGPALEIEQGRHPVVEQMLRSERLGLAGAHTFVPNDTWLSNNVDQIALITGPNMAGKSTYIRQVALIALMAQVGCWVPADRAHIGVVDRIFARVGASDELARGNSTFMVEMNETANIMNNATDRSLIILDEIGRGTSTYDGLSIAWAVIEHLHQHEDQGPKTLFATHYHELTRLEEVLTRLRNYSVSVKEWNDEIVFIRQVIPGAADRSYGIQVARLAGLPADLIDRATNILEELESEGRQLQEHLFKKKFQIIAEKRTVKSRDKGFNDPAQMALL